MARPGGEEIGAGWYGEVMKEDICIMLGAGGVLISIFMALIR